MILTIAPILLYFLAWQTAAKNVWPCSQQTTIDGNGVEVWNCAHNNDEPETVYKVRDFGAMRPTLVYNCRNVAGLCNNVKEYLGSGVSTKTLHYDANDDRVNLRRGSVCPTSWIDQVRLDGTNRCPEPSQPLWKFQKCIRRVGGECKAWEDHRSGQDPVMWEDKSGVQSNNRLAKREVLINAKGEVTEKYTKMGAVLSCDEWPAASWIEGGAGDIKTSNTYCSPIGQKCGNTAALRTEQNWQASGHAALRIWFQKQSTDPGRLNWKTQTDQDEENYSIFKFNFRYEDVDSALAVYVEANGQKRYCYGFSGSDSNCQPDWPGDPAAPNPY